MFRDEAIVLVRYDFGESSQIASLLTKEHGKRRVIAKGARRERSRPAASRGLDLASRIRGAIYPKKGDALALLGDWEVLDYWGPLRRRLESVHFALFLCEFLETVCPLDDPLLRAYELALGVLRELGRGAEEWRASYLAGVVGLLGTLGDYRPTSECIACGVSIDKVRTLRFAPAEGGILCPRCRPRAWGSFISRPAAAILRTLGEANLDASRVEVGRDEAREIWEALSGVVRRVTERRLRLEPEIDRWLGLVRGVAPRARRR